MATKLLFPFPIFAPPNSSVPQHRRPVTEIRFSRWNNAKAEPFNLRKRAQQEIENDIRRHRRFDSASNIATIYENATATTTTTTTTTTFKSIGTPSSPSKPSIPGKRSKYSKNANPNHNSQSSHPAFRRIRRTTKMDRHQQRNQKNDNNLSEQQSRVKPSVEVSEDGVSYKVDGLPFEMMYSYTETPKAKPIALREPPFSPFGPQTMARPWTGRAPLPESKKKLKEFDSFVLPPPHKKGVKPVQAPGPFLLGSGPKYVKSREEILGEALTQEEVKELVKSCLKSTRQLNIGRDGLTHNMLDNIHAHWKRKRVCKIKCKGVCTVDMDNVRQQLEEKTGGKIIYSRGGVLFLFRGRNYNYRTRPRFPIMLWKPVTPVYPRLVKRAPEGLTLEKAGEMRKKGRELIPICKLAKNGVYSDLVRNVREAFEACELVRINCQGLNGSDYRKIGAKLKDLVPCVLISFEHEHILMWRGNDWKSSLPNKEDDGKEAKEFKTDDPTSIVQSLEEHEISSSVSDISVPYTSRETLSTSILVTEDESKELSKDLSCNGNNMQVSSAMKTSGSGTILNGIGCADDESKDMRNTHASETILDTTGPDNEELAIKLVGSDVIKAEIGSSETLIIGPITEDKLRDVAEVSYSLKELTVLKTRSTEGVLLLLKQALEGGNAIILDNVPLDADTVYERAVAFSKSAPPGPVFRHRPRKVAVQRWEKKGTGDLKANEVVAVPEKRASQRKSLKSQRMNEFKGDDLDVMPKGSLRVDELAKLLA